MNTLVKILAFLALVAVCLGEELVDCEKKFKKVTDNKDHADNIALCQKELKLPEPKESDEVTEKQFIDSHYDDKCVAKCAMEKMHFYKDGKFVKADILKDAESMVVDDDKAFKAKVSEFTTKCLDEAEKETKTPCSPPSYFAYCIGKAHEKLCKPLPPPKKE